MQNEMEVTEKTTNKDSTIRVLQFTSNEIANLKNVKTKTHNPYKNTINLTLCQ